MGAVTQLMEKHGVRIKRGRTAIHSDQGVVERFNELCLSDCLVINMQKNNKIDTNAIENGLKDYLRLSSQ